MNSAHREPTVRWQPVFLRALRQTGNVSSAARAICRDLFGAGFDGWAVARQHALISMAYNLSGPRLARFRHMRAAIAAGDWSRAAAEAMNSRWASQTGRRAMHIASMMRGDG